MLHRLYIGSDNSTKLLALDLIKAVVGSMFDGFSVSVITGYWMKSEEQTALVEIETKDTDKVKQLAHILKNNLKQDSVGLVILPVEMQFV